MKAPVFLLAFILYGFAATASAATLVVTKTEDTNDGVCDADCSLREAVAAAAADDTVAFSSLFNTPHTITLTLGQIAITRNLTVNGAGRELLTLNGNHGSRIFRISGGAIVNISGMKLTDGLASYANEAYGGGVAVFGSTLTLTSVSVADNEARDQQSSSGYGGGVYVDTGTLNVVDSSINNNSVPDSGNFGGGGLYGRYSTLNLTRAFIDSNIREGVNGTGSSSQPSIFNAVDTVITNNTVMGLRNGSGHTTLMGSTIRNNGGGISGNDTSDSTLVIDRSVISNNEPNGGIRNGGMSSISNTSIDNNFANGIGADGGGVKNFGTMYVVNSSVTRNRAFELGGGIYNAVGRLYLTNSTVSGNVADDGSGNCNCPGGGLYVTGNGGGVVLTDATVARNRSASLGGGIYISNPTDVSLRNSIVAENLSTTSGADISGTVTSEGFNLVGNTNGSSGWIASDLLNRNPLLAPLANNGGSTLTHAILPGSPAINAGSNALARDPFDNSPLVNDQRGPGFMRLVGNVDIGAYEANYAPGPVTVGGRVTTSGGRGIAGVRVTFTSGGTTLYAQTNPFGYYRFANLQPGTTYAVAATDKYYLFPTPIYTTIDQNRTDLNFTAQ